MKDLDNTTEQVGSLKKRELCYKKQPHNFELILPDFVSRKNPDATPEQVEAYYLSEQRIKDFQMNEVRELEKLGVYTQNWNAIRPVSKYYKCSGCGKREYDLKIKK